MNSPDLSTDLGRLRALVAWGRTTPAGLSKLAKLAPPHIGMVLRGDIKALSADTAKAVASATGCTVGWLLNGEGDAPDVDAVASACAGHRPLGSVFTASDFTREVGHDTAPDVAEPSGPVVVRDGFDQTGTGA